MVVPKLTAANYEEFDIAFSSVAARTIGYNGIPLDYLFWETPGIYQGPWSTRLEKLKNCIALHGPIFKEDNELLYSLLVQYIGTNNGPGVNKVKKYHDNKNGRECYLDLRKHFRNDSYLENKATSTMDSINQGHYGGDRRNF